jgi:glycosyltransferase involved in cell wall biosynthesis
MKVLILSKEYPPHVYGGAGVHVDFLSRALSKLAQVEVRCFGEQRSPGGADSPSVRGFGPWNEAIAELDPKLRKALEPLTVDLAIAGAPTDADLVHCHTWYSMMAGLWNENPSRRALVITTHSLEPLRPGRRSSSAAVICSRAGSRRPPSNRPTP